MGKPRLGNGVGSHFLEAWEMENYQLFSMTGNELVFFEAAENSAGGLFCEPCHIGQVLVGQPNGNSNAVAFLNTGPFYQIHQEGRYALFCPV